MSKFVAVVRQENGVFGSGVLVLVFEVLFKKVKMLDFSPPPLHKGGVGAKLSAAGE